MILIRRVLVAPLIILFPVVLLLALVLLRVNATVLEPRFYTGTLERLNAYNFLYDEAVPLAIRESGMDLRDVPLGLDLTPEDVAGYMKRVAPPEWLQDNVSTVIHQVVPYMTGRADTFQVNVRLDDRVNSAADVLREVVHDAQLHAFLIDEVVRPELERNQTALQDLPFGLRLTVDQVVDGVVQVVPEDWLKTQAIGVVDEVVPYIVAEADGFRVVVPLQDRAEVAVLVLEQWLLESLDGGANQYLLDELVGPMVGGALAGVQLPYGVTITQPQVIEAVGDAVPDWWVRERVMDVTETLAAYITGRSDTFALVVPLGDVSRPVAEALVALVDAEVEMAYNAARACTLQEVADLVFTPGRLPECRIPGMSYEQAKLFAGYNSSRLVDQVARAMPPSIGLGQEALLGGLGPAVVERLRSVLRDGYVFTDADLRGMLSDQDGPGTADTLEDLRGYMRDGFTFSDADLRDRAGDGFQQVETVRGYVGTARRWAFLSLLPAVLLAAGAGFLGGRTWWTRLAWAGIPLVVGGIVVVGASGAVAGPLRGLTEPLIQGLDAPAAVVAKIIQLRNELVRAFITPLAIQGVLIALLGAAAIAGGIVMARRQDAIFRDALGIPLELEEREAVYR